jgi:hypothetical protein
MQPIAVPVPSPARYELLPRYCSELLVREDSGRTTLAELAWVAERKGYASIR